MNDVFKNVYLICSICLTISLFAQDEELKVEINQTLPWNKVIAVSEIDLYVQGRGAIGDFLAETFKAYHDDHFAWSKEIWDVVAVAYLINSNWILSEIISSPIIAERPPVKKPGPNPYPWEKQQLSWSFDHARHKIRCAYYVDRDPIFRDLFTKLDRFSQEKPKVK